MQTDLVTIIQLYNCDNEYTISCDIHEIVSTIVWQYHRTSIIENVKRIIRIAKVFRNICKLPLGIIYESVTL